MEKCQNILYIILIIILIFKNQYINSLAISGRFPLTFLMSNGNIFLMTSDKIQILDQGLKELYSSHDFSNNQIDNGLSLRNIAQFSDGYIIALLEYSYFIFSEEGEYIHEIILENNKNLFIESYSLILYKFDSEYHYYIIAFGLNSIIRIQYYKLKIHSGNTLLKEFDYTARDSSGNGHSLIRNAISCQLMKKDGFDEILACFYEINYINLLEARLFTISNNNNITEIELDKASSSHEESTTIIKSAVSRNKKKALICYIIGVCLTYDVDLNEFTNEKKYIKKCKEDYTLMNVYYFQEKDEFIFICNDADNSAGFNIVKFDSSFHASNTEILDKPNYSYGNLKQDIHTFNLLYLPSFNDYAFISDYAKGDDRYYIGGVNLSKMKALNNLPNEEMQIEPRQKTVEEIIKEFDDILSDKEPNKTYIIKEENYTIIIKPIDEKVEESTINIDFSECKEKLKQKYPNKQFKIVQINLVNSKENCLNDQVEYKIYDEDGQPIELSACKDLNIKIGYQIKNTSKLNIPKILELNGKGIDIFDIKSEFYNDICFPYSDDDSDSDMILYDRVTDIYQNYSLCGKECKYDSFNIEKKTAYCNCKVKQEVSAELEEGNFQSYIKTPFLYSNFGIIKCYKVVFELKEKLNNVGFWIFGVLIIFHFPLDIYYFIKGTNPMEKYINKEMNDKGYTSKSKRIQINKINAGYSLSSFNKNNSKSKKNKKNKKKKKISSKNENNNPPPKNGNNKGKLNDRIPESKDIIYKDDEIKYYKINKFKIRKIIANDCEIPIEEKNEKKMKDLNTINPDEIQVDNNYAKENLIIENFKKNIKRNKFKKFTHKNFKSIITDSNEALNTNECIDYKKEIHSDKNVKKQKSEEEIEENNKDINGKENNNYALILINANNKGNHLPLTSNYILNNYDYEEAIHYEQRSFLRLFFIYLISKDPVLNIIFLNPPLELKPLRLCIFIFSYSCDLALNAFFYLSEKISEKYHYTGPHRTLFCIINNLIISFVSTIVSFMLLYFFYSLTQSSSTIEDLFKEQEKLLKSDKKYKVNERVKKRIEDDLSKIIKCLRIKIICFAIFEFLFMLFFFYYVTAFCQIYNKTQISWLLDFISSYIISLLISFSISLICSILYIISIKYQRKTLYKIVMFLYEYI
jgi:hypothetical protein